VNKKQLSAALAASTDLSQVQAASIVNTLFDAESGIIAAELKGGGKVTIPGFGTFNVKTRAARTGTNPSTGAKMNIPERNHVAFKAGKVLKDSVA